MNNPSSSCRPVAIAVAVCTVLSLAIYSGFWMWMAGQIDTEMRGFVAEAEQKEIHIMPRQMEVRGYPGTHEAYFSGRIAVDSALAEIPSLAVSSHFLPGQKMSIEAAQGVTIMQPLESAVWSLDQLRIDTTIPKLIPGELTHEDLAAWRDAGGVLTIDNLEIRKGSLAIKGNGHLMLDEDLQPFGDFQARVTGHIAFLQWLQAQNLVETKDALLAASVLSALSKTDPDTNEIYMDVTLTLQNRTFFVGPLRLGSLPMIEWGWRSQPVQLQ